MATHFGTLAWKIPWTEEPGRLQSMGSLRVRWDWATLLSCIGEGNGNPLQCSSLENRRDRGAWWAAVYGVAQSQTNLKWLSSSSSIVVQQKPIQYCKAIVLQLKKKNKTERQGGWTFATLWPSESQNSDLWPPIPAFPFLSFWTHSTIISLFYSFPSLINTSRIYFRLL